MNALGRALPLALLVRKPISVVKRSISTSTRLAAYFEKDFLPGPYPKTEEERLKAAKKYGMQPEDYKPFESYDQWGTGDYPDVEAIGMDLKSDYDVYDDKALKINYNEPLPMKEFQYYSYIDYGRSFYPMTERQIWAHFIGIFATYALLEYFFHTYFMRHDEALPKQFPFSYEGHGTYWHHSNIKRNIHYTFEPAEPAEGSE